MSDFLTTHFQSDQRLLIKSVIVSHFNILNQKIAKYDGFVRIRAKLVNGGLLEFAEYIELDNNRKMIDHVYSFHWQDAQNQLVQRWDNADHDAKLPFAPHHVHYADRTVEGNPELPTLESILRIIEQLIA